MNNRLLHLSLTLLLAFGWQLENHGQARQDRITSKWARQLDPASVHQEYPRPQMVREQWLNLNGLWNYAITEDAEAQPLHFDGEILVPFPVESALSGVQKRLSDRQLLWYQRNFEIPEKWKGREILLHFGAVDWEARVFVNGEEIGMHQGGYDPFSFNITRALKTSGKQEIVLSVWDPTSEGTQPRGKQVTRPEAIWYTPVSGIWQTVWLEPVSEQSIAGLRFTPDVDRSQVEVLASARRDLTERYEVTFEVYSGSEQVATATGALNEVLPIPLPHPELWSPDSPSLYDVKVTLSHKGGTVDELSSYFAMRKISMEVASDGHERLFLNNKPLFQYGTLDQGWWPGGLYTAPSDDALRHDIEVTRDCGFNMIRKHVKVEPARWYYHCDRLGMLVWQDMPNGDEKADWRGPSGYDGREMERTAQSAHQFRKEWKEIMDDFYHFPSIVMWVPFNEGWGQFNTVEVINWTMKYDPTRLVNGPSGGNFFPAGHTVDHHQYPGPGMPDEKKHAPDIIQDRALILGEFGGLGLPVEGHLWQNDKNWGYRNFDDRKVLLENYARMVGKIPSLIRKGLAGAIYTQTTDVEGEVNGLMTYDREVIKMPPEEMRKISKQLFEPL